MLAARRSLVTLFALLPLIGFLPLLVTAQEPAKPKTDDKPPEFKEQTVYIPYTKLREVFEKEGRGVFLPYDKFRELWQAAREKTDRPVPVKTPFTSLITEASHEATVSRDVLQVSSRIRFEAIGEGWHRLPLRLEDAAITSAKLGDQPARLVHEPGKGYFLLVERRKGEAEQGELLLEYAKSFDKTPGRNSVSFQTPQAPVSRWQVRIDEPGVKIDIHPLIAASDVPADPKIKHSQVQAFVGAAETVKVEWVPRAEGAQGLEAIAHVHVEQHMTVDENVARTRAKLQYTVSRAELARLTFSVPADQRVVNVFDPNVKQWSVAAPADGVQKVTVELFEPAKASQTLTVEIERLASDDLKQPLVAPVIAAQGVGRQQGTLLVHIAEGLRAEVVKRSGLLQIDGRELPPAMVSTPWTFAYRYAAVPYELSLGVEKVQPRIVADSLVEANLQPDRLTLDVQTILTIERAGVFRLEWDVPADFTVRHVRGLTKPGVEPVTVESHRIEGDAKNRLVVNLGRKALGRVGLDIQLSRVLANPELLAPQGKSATISVPVPRVVPTLVERSTGRVVIYAPESLRVNPQQLDGLRTVPLEEAQAGIGPASPPTPTVRPVQAFMFSDAAAVLSVAAERRKPHVTGRQLLAVRVEPGVVKYQSAITYDILYSGVKTLRIDVPSDLVTKIHNDSAGIRESTIAPPPAGVPEGYTAWSLAGEAEFLGQVVVKFSWEQQLEGFEIGKSMQLALPHVRPQDTDRAWGQILLAKAEAIDLIEQGDPTGLRPIDPQQDVMPGAPWSDAARAYEFHEDWKLTLSATRYELEEVKRTSIERAVVRVVATRSGQQTVQAIYRLRSARQRLAIKLPDKIDFDATPLRINGKPVTLERDDKAVRNYYVPLANQAADTVSVLELRYSYSPPDGQTVFILPEFPENPAVQKIYLSVYLPEIWSVVAAAGPFNDELQWHWGGWRDRTHRRWGFAPYPLRNDQELINWVTEGVALPGNLHDSLPTDGRLYVFSTLSPAAGSDLRLSTIDTSRLNMLVGVLVLVGGVVLLRWSAGPRVLVLGATAALLVLLAVFRPWLSYELVNEGLLGAALIVGIVWAVWFVVWTWPRRGRVAPPPVSSPPAAPSNVGAYQPSVIFAPTDAPPASAEPGESSPQSPEGDHHA